MRRRVVSVAVLAAGATFTLGVIWWDLWGGRFWAIAQVAQEGIDDASLQVVLENRRGELDELVAHCRRVGVITPEMRSESLRMGFLDMHFDVAEQRLQLHATRWRSLAGSYDRYLECLRDADSAQRAGSGVDGIARDNGECRKAFGTWWIRVK